MNDLKVFFNTEIFCSPSILSELGNFGLTPVRYLFNGKTLRRIAGNEPYLFRSFYEEKTFLKVVAAIALLIPGLILATAKLASYIFADTRKDHQIVKECLLAAPRGIGSFPRPTPPPTQPSIPTPPPIQQPTPMALDSIHDQPTDYIIYESRTQRNVVRAEMNELRTQITALENATRERRRRARHRPMQIDG